MGIVFKVKVNLETGDRIRASRDELLSWLKSKNAYRTAYYDWRLVKYLEIMDFPCEVVVFHHDLPPPNQVTPEMCKQAKECFEKNGVLHVWWWIILEWRLEPERWELYQQKSNKKP